MKKPKTPGPTAEETALRDVSSKTYNDVIAQYRPAEAALVKRMQLTPGKIAQVKGGVSGDVAESYKGLTRSSITANAARGADVNSAAAKFGLASDAASQGAISGRGQSMAVTGAKVNESDQLVQMTGFGRGMAHDTISDMAQGARRAGAISLADATAKYERNKMYVDTAATIAGAAWRKFGDPWVENQKLAREAEKRGLGIPEFSEGYSPVLGEDTVGKFTKYSGIPGLGETNPFSTELGGDVLKRFKPKGGFFGGGY